MCEKDDLDEKLERVREYLWWRTELVIAYHDHKENMAHAGFLVLLAVAGVVLNIGTWPPAWVPGGNADTGQAVAAMIVIGLWFVLHLSIRWQLRKRRWADRFVGAANKVLRQWSYDTPSSTELRPNKEKLSAPRKFFSFLDAALFPVERGTEAHLDHGLLNYPKIFVDEFESCKPGSIRGERLSSLGSYFILAVLLIRVFH